MRDFGFNRCSFIQESLSATFGSGVTQACVVDVGAQKTSICCVEEGMCLENSRINLKYGGADVTETFAKMMLFDHFPYQEINLNRRYDFLLAEEIKVNFCHLEEDSVVVYLYDFHLRAPGQETRKYSFKTYDEPFLAVQGFFNPSIFDNASKLNGRRKIVPPSTDLYDGSPNDPVSSAQSAVVALISPPAPPAAEANWETNSTPSRQLSGVPSRLNEPADLSSAAADSQAGDDDATPAPAADGNATTTPHVLASSIRDDVLPIIGLDIAIVTSIAHGSRGDERKMRDFIGQVMLIGGCSLIKGMDSYLEERLKIQKPSFAKEVLVGGRPKDLDPQVVIWKGGSIFGRLRSTNDCWIGRLEYDRLGARLLAYKCMWAW